MANRTWSPDEVAATVRAYLDMLELEIAGVGFNKAKRNRELRTFLDERSHGAVERKHQNISAILIEWGLPYVDGYKPLGNYQALLADELAVQLEARSGLRATLEAVVRNEDVSSSRVTPPTFEEMIRRLVDPPTMAKKPADRVRSSSATYNLSRRTNYLALEAANRALGLAGEEFVVTFETARLSLDGREDLAARIEHTSVERGDGAGFDVLSFDATGAERLIEVKTTRFGGYTPFFITRNELRVSKEESTRYHLYRVYKFEQNPTLFTVGGALDDCCDLEPTEYLGRIA